MKTYLLNLWDVLRSSYWFLPSLFAAGAVALSLFMPWVDIQVDASEGKLPEWILTTTNTARSTLSALAGAMVAVTGTVFSITIVTLSLASQQLGPRLLRRFMFDLPTQVTLGVFVSTGLYCLLLLRVVESREDGLVAPHLSVLTAIVLAVFSMAVLIGFIHHIAVLIQAPQAVAAVAADLDDAIGRLFPEKMGQPLADVDGEPHGEEDLPDASAEGVLLIRANRQGYIQAIDGQGLLELARQRDLVVRLRCRPGNFLAEGAPVADVWTPSECRFDGDADDSTVVVNDTIIVGIRRTPRQDVECAVDELVEVAVRSLSPGINDPFTAINVIDRLGASLRMLAQRNMPSSHRYDEDGQLRVIARSVTFANVLDAALNQIRQYGRDSVAVTIRLLETLASLAECVSRPEDRASVQLHAEMIARGGESFPETRDRKAVRDAFESVIATLEGNDPQQRTAASVASNA